MLTSIRKITTSFLAKVLIVIIILPFLFWGMGDVFRGGNQNILATIDSEKISAQRFVEYVNRLGLNEEQRKNLGKTDTDKIPMMIITTINSIKVKPEFFFIIMHILFYFIFTVK